MTNDDGTSKIMVTLPTKYYNALTRLKDGGIIPSYAAAVKDALIEWLDTHNTTLLILNVDGVTLDSTDTKIR